MALVREIVVRPLLAAMRAGSRRCGRILLYHRVVGERCHPCIRRFVGSAITRAAFERQLDYLARHYRVVDLHTLLSSMDRPGNMAAITFDDGYADNLLEALPALERRGLPATLFAVAGWTGSPHRAWWDRLARLVADNGPRTLRLDAGGTTAEFPFTGDAKTQYKAALPWIEALTDEQRDALFAGRFISDDDRFLDADELRGLDHRGFRIEAHTVTHRRLSKLDDADALEELSRGKTMLEEALGRPVTCLAYPFGMRGDFTDATRRLAVQAGYHAAFAAHGGLIRGGGDRFALPRLGVGEDFNRFRFKVSRWRAAT
jgi:peptidoglycan/xylan/chitin deacetylase (PgdA/CDA1 family)